MGKHYQIPMPVSFPESLFTRFELVNQWEVKPIRLSAIKREMGAPPHVHHFGRWVVEAAKTRGWELRIRRVGNVAVVDCLHLKTTIP